MKSALPLLCRLALGSVFLLAGISKIPDPAGFLLTMRGFQLFPDLPERFLAVYVPWLEAVLGVCLLLGILVRAASLLFAFLIAGFTAAIVSVMARGIVVDCGCFGLLADYLPLPDAADFRAVVRNLVFLAMALAVFFSKRTRFSLEDYLRRKT